MCRYRWLPSCLAGGLGGQLIPTSGNVSAVRGFFCASRPTRYTAAMASDRRTRVVRFLRIAVSAVCVLLDFATIKDILFHTYCV
jgi:hypothetical protein